MNPQDAGLIVVAIIAVGIWGARHAKDLKAGLTWMLVAGLVACLAVQAMS